MGAKLEAGGTDQVANIFDDQQIEKLKVKLAEGALQHHCVKVTLTAGVDLDSGCAGGSCPIRIQAGGDVAIDHRQA